MNTPQRKKARDDFKALFALSRVAGENKNGYFIFKSLVHMQEYERILREMESRNERLSQQSNPEA
ncbi:hypothetical protein [Paenibacillus vini]|uniref:Uncharacterized protein n=1 Tax=Paenibacillus vini TaxID=1476024 RepID=A0ABQ4MIU8_9BACL|nr:hypothetical protein [Paenibacillus vini]GIP55913.1 hypothetical protein J42TS3_49480 [Paenibacillus vini]